MSSNIDRFPRSKPRVLANILLTCGCTVRTRDVPIYAEQKFICASGMGHGYKGQGWVRCDFGGQIAENFKG